MGIQCLYCHTPKVLPSLMTGVFNRAEEERKGKVAIYVQWM